VVGFWAEMVPTQFNCVLASGDAWEPEFAVRLLRSDHHSVEQDRSSGGYAINGERSRMQERRQCEIKFGGISLVNWQLAVQAEFEIRSWLRGLYKP